MSSGMKRKDCTNIYNKEIKPLLEKAAEIADKNSIPYLWVTQIGYIPGEDGQTDFKSSMNCLPEETHPVLFCMGEVIRGSSVLAAFRPFIEEEVSSLITGMTGRKTQDEALSALLANTPKAQA